MRWDILGLILLIVMSYSQFEMISCAYVKHKDKYESFFCFYDSYSISDYIEITRAENGRIGGWFWVFVFSVILLVVAAVNGMSSEADFGSCIRMNQDDVWPML